MLLPVLAGGLGGGLNAFLCYVGFLVDFELDWASGRVRCVSWCPLVALKFLHARGRTLLWLGAGMAGYLSGWLWGITVLLSLGGQSWAELWTWPFKDAVSNLEIVAEAVRLFWDQWDALLCWNHRIAWVHIRGLGLNLAVGILSGSIGYYWFWHSLGWLRPDETWLLGPIHGSIWGALVGLGTRHSERSSRKRA